MRAPGLASGARERKPSDFCIGWHVDAGALADGRDASLVDDDGSVMQRRSVRAIYQRPIDECRNLLVGRRELGRRPCWRGGARGLNPSVQQVMAVPGFLIHGAKSPPLNFATISS